MATVLAIEDEGVLYQAIERRLPTLGHTVRGASRFAPAEQRFAGRHPDVTLLDLRLVNLSNDSWFGDQPSLQQHFHAVLFRAVENRRFLLRATNAGIMAIVDPRGVVIATAPRNAAVVLAGAIVPIQARTLCTRLGDAFGWGCLGVALAALRRPRAR